MTGRPWQLWGLTLVCAIDLFILGLGAARATGCGAQMGTEPEDPQLCAACRARSET